MKQDDRYEYPGGHLGVLVLSKIPVTVKKVRDLKQVELPAFVKGCEEMFRYVLTIHDRALACVEY